MCKTFAITYTVKNELRLLKKAIAYHTAQGCSRFYIYLDGTTDSTRQQFDGLSNIVILDSIVPDHILDRPKWIIDIEPWWVSDMDVRKRINNFDAARRAATENIEWLVSIDPDELLYFPEGSSSKEFFHGTDPKIDQILFPNLEALPPRGASDNPFTECVLFLNRFDLTETFWRVSSSAVRRLTKSSKMQAWYDHFYYRIRFLSALPRLFREPRTGDAIPAGYFLGYSNHKSAIRPHRATEFDFVIHKWRKFRRKPTSIKKGNVLHYDLCSAEYFMQKFGQRQSSMLLPVFYLRYRLALVARDFHPDEVTEFFERYIAIGSGETGDILVKRGIARKIEYVSSFFKGT